MEPLCNSSTLYNAYCRKENIHMLLSLNDVLEMLQDFWEFLDSIPLLMDIVNGLILARLKDWFDKNELF